MKQKMISALMIGALALSAMPACASDDEQSFVDVGADAWYYGVVSEMVAEGYMNGISATHFAPDEVLTREMFVTLLGRVAQVEPARYDGETVFDDVYAGAWYAPYVAWAQETGLVSGITADAFGVGQAITREQMAALVTRFVNQLTLVTMPEDAQALEAFSDQDAVAPYAQDAVAFVRVHGLMNGAENAAFQPKAATTRAESAAVLSRLLDKLQQCKVALLADDIQAITLKAQTTVPPTVLTVTEAAEVQQIVTHLQAMPIEGIAHIPASTGWQYWLEIVWTDGTRTGCHLNDGWIEMDGIRYDTTEGYFTALLEMVG